MKQIKVKTVEFYGELRWESKYMYFVHDGINAIGIPKSAVIKLRKISGSDYEFILPETIARQKGII